MELWIKFKITTKKRDYWSENQHTDGAESQSGRTEGPKVVARKVEEI